MPMLLARVSWPSLFSSLPVGWRFVAMGSQILFSLLPGSFRRNMWCVFGVCFGWSFRSIAQFILLRWSSHQHWWVRLAVSGVPCGFLGVWWSSDRWSYPSLCCPIGLFWPWTILRIQWKGCLFSVCYDTSDSVPLLFSRSSKSSNLKILWSGESSI